MILLLLFLIAQPEVNSEYTYHGDWNTKQRKLSGTQTAIIKNIGNDKWEGKFFGVWEGRKFSYSITFSGKPDKLSGQATIDGADYEWTGVVSPENFSGKFDGRRYTGSFDMKRKK